METLFPIEPRFPEGFGYYPDFLSEEEESILLAESSKIDFHSFIFQGYEAKRKVASFGYDYSFDAKSISKGKPIPLQFYPLIEKVAASLSLQATDFAELLITQYPVGSVINWHRDAPPFDLIAGISLLSDCTFRLRPHEKIKQNRSSLKCQVFYHPENPQSVKKTGFEFHFCNTFTELIKLIYFKMNTIAMEEFNIRLSFGVHPI